MFILFALLFSLFALFLAFKLHDKFDPARYFMILWGAQIVVIYAFFHASFLFPGLGLVFISICCLLFSVGTLTGQFLGSPIETTSDSYFFKEKSAIVFLKICFILALGYGVQGIYNNGFNILQILTFNALLELNNAASVTRYTTVASSNLFSQLTLIFVYLAPLFGGYLLPLISKRKNYWCYLVFVPALLISLTQALKSVFITSVALWGVGILVSSYANNKSFLKIRLATVVRILLFSMLFFAILFISMVFRTGKFDLETVHDISIKFVTYAFGHLPTFDVWFSNNMGNIEPTGGVKTFYGISNYLGIAERKQGVFAEYTYFGRSTSQHILPEIETNIYTLFRFILEDFGYIGSLLLFFFTGIISGYSWVRIKRQNTNRFFQVVLVAILFFISWSFVASVWAYTSYIAMILLFYFLLLFSFSKKIEDPLHVNSYQ